MSDNAYTPPTSTVADRYGSMSGAITPGILEQLRRTRPWVLLVAVVFLILALLMILIGAAMLAGGSAIMGASPEIQAIGGTGMIQGMGVVYILMSLLFYLLPSILLFRYAGAISKAVNSADATEAEIAISRQASFWKFVGILVLIGIVLFVVGFVAAIMLPAIMSGGVPATP